MNDAHLEADRTFGPCHDPSCPGSRFARPEEAAAPALPQRVTLTRRTARFGDLAARIEDRLAELGIVVDPNGVDADLRARVRTVAEQLGVSDRTALNYATDDLADETAKKIAITARAILAELGLDQQRPARHLRVVR